MSNIINGAPTLSNDEIISLGDQINELMEQQQKLKQECDRIAILINVVKAITTIHLGVPINIKTEKLYNSTLCKITNVTPTAEQFREERHADYPMSDADKPVQLTMRLNNPLIANSTITCPNREAAHALALDFVATGKFPLINKLLCKFEKEKQKAPND